MILLTFLISINGVVKPKVPVYVDNTFVTYIDPTKVKVSLKNNYITVVSKE